MERVSPNSPSSDEDPGFDGAAHGGALQGERCGLDKELRAVDRGRAILGKEQGAYRL